MIRVCRNYYPYVYVYKRQLYDFWGSSVADILSKETDTIINLASKEYSKVVSDNIGNNINFIMCSFAQIINGKPVEKGTLCKMARGEMVRYMAENNIKDYKNIKNFNRMNFSYSDALSNESTFVFIKSN